MGAAPSTCNDLLVILRKARSLVLAFLTTAVPCSVFASNPYLEVPAAEEFLRSPAYTYANLDNAQVAAELQKRELPFTLEPGPVRGVRLPGRLTGPLHGVLIHGTSAASEAATSPYEILDGRLALALDDWCRVLATHDIVEVVHYTLYRPPPSSVSSADGLTRHAGGLAIDVGSVRKRDGTWLVVGKEWSPSPGSRTCGPGGRVPESAKGQELLALVCESRDLRIFHYALTPHFNAAHADHLHLEIKPGVKWLLYN